MSRYNPHLAQAELLLQSAILWRDRCLIDQGSLFTDDELWRPELINKVRRAFVDNPLETEESFMEKLRQQFADETPEAVRLLAEVYWVLNLFPSNMGGELKKSQVMEIWSWSGNTLPKDHPLLDVHMLEGIGSGGMGFLAHRWRELRYLLNLLAAWFELEQADRRKLIDDAWRFAEWVESIPDPGYRQMRHILPYLLFPDTFERIASPTHIQRILQRLGQIESQELRRMNKLDRDRALLAIRERLEAEKRGPIDFYESDFEGRWREASNAGLSVADADHLLAQSFARTNTTDKIASFETPSGRPVALDRKASTVQIWVTPPVPEIDGIALKRHYRAEETRNSNLPAGLRRGREVLLLNATTPAGLEELIDALSGEDSPLPEEAVVDEPYYALGPYVPLVDADDLEGIANAIAEAGLLYDFDLIVRYHLGLRVRNFVILAGDSGTGKTALAVAYSKAIGAALHVEPVAPNWTSNEDLLGFLSPVDDIYRHTATSQFLERSAAEFAHAAAGGRRPQPFHLLLDEMNLARVEHYFARFLSAMERRDSSGAFEIELAPGRRLRIGPNLFVVGTVNVDETTHGFAEKVYDRAQLIDVEASANLIAKRLGDKPYAEPLLRLWHSARGVAPFSFRTLDGFGSYLDAGTAAGLDWRTCMDHQLRQKILPKIRGADPRLAGFLDACLQVSTDFDLPLTRAKAEAMAEQLRTHGYASYF